MAEYGLPIEASASLRTSSKRPLVTASWPAPGITDGGVDPSGREAQRRHSVELGQAPVLDSACGFDEFLGPPDGFVLFTPGTYECRIVGDGRRSIEVVV